MAGKDAPNRRFAFLEKVYVEDRKRWKSIGDALRHLREEVRRQGERIDRRGERLDESIRFLRRLLER